MPFYFIHIYIYILIYVHVNVYVRVHVHVAQHLTRESCKVRSLDKGCVI